MPLDTQRTRQYLKAFDFRPLFNEELGWERYAATLQVKFDGLTFILTGIAEKRGLVAFLCSSSDDRIPDYTTRRKIEARVTKTAFEHIIIYSDAGRTTQVWQWVKREAGKPVASREHTYHVQQPGDALIQKLQAIVFSLEEEESLTTVSVAGRVRAAFDVERITKRFYDRFKTEHAQFLKFIQGIPDEEIRRWYASVMINRLMFIYFIQKKGLLDNDSDYLRTKLEESKKRGKDLFYVGFLSPLFFKGFAEKQRSEATEQLLGNVPYLNGGLFLKHQIEERHGNTIEISDSAFERIFNFFDAYQWHLDERPLRRDNEINPDVLGYIFEKYINQKQMGAYYSKEDITEYISKNTVIPFLFERAREKCKIAFEGQHAIWQLLQVDPDRYIYRAVRHGVTWDIHGDRPLENPYKLPVQIADGLDTSKPNLIERRKSWNQPAPPEYALPTEIWREVIARRNRYGETHRKLSAGEVRDINDLITHNLDIRQFAQDVIENCEGPDLLNAFWQAIEKVTVLDPACGSGAFLFAALNILEPLYEACLDRMDAFLYEWGEQGKRIHPNYHKLFSTIHMRAQLHPNRRYFILKSIIINNLFGVDIMEEASEICKLRLFLKLVAQVESDEQIEPLPDIDFNIRAGNTLVGYASYEDVKRAVASKFDFEDAMGTIEEKASDVDRLFLMFRQQQTEFGGEVTAQDKRELHKRLKTLEDQLNEHLSYEYGIKSVRGSQYTSWLHSHKPFHWFVEFHALMKRGGFDVIIGNPPYVEYKDVQDEYSVRNFSTLDCGDLYALVMERSTQLLSPCGGLALIVPVSIVSTERFAGLRNLLLESQTASWTVSFAERPSKLFEGVEKRLTIWLSHRTPNAKRLFLSSYHRWLSLEREHLFSRIAFVSNDTLPKLVGSAIPKISSVGERTILNRLAKESPLSTFLSNVSGNIVYYTRKLRYFIQFLDFIPRIRDGRGRLVEPSELKTLAFGSARYKNCALATLNSSLFFWFFSVYSDVRNVNRREIISFPCSLNALSRRNSNELTSLSALLMEDLEKKSKDLSINYKKHGQLVIQTFQPRSSKPLIDKIDAVLAEHYSFAEEELDFIINFDVKYRMGLADDREDGE
jgi:Eco57I restriction-modification methylase